MCTPIHLLVLGVALALRLTPKFTVSIILNLLGMKSYEDNTTIQKHVTSNNGRESDIDKLN